MGEMDAGADATPPKPAAPVELLVVSTSVERNLERDRRFTNCCPPSLGDNPDGDRLGDGATTGDTRPNGDSSDTFSLQGVAPV